MQIFINKVEVHGEVTQEGEEFYLSFNVHGANNYHLFSNLIKEDIFDIKVPQMDQEFKAKRINHSSSYRNSLEENTLINFCITYKEHIQEEEEKKEWNPLVGVGQTAINNWIRTRALSELLEEKGIITRKEYDDKLKEIGKRDFEDMKAFIGTGEYPKKEEVE